MKKFFSNLISFVRENSLNLILFVLLLASISFSIKTKSDLDKYLINKDIRGTFTFDSSPVQMPVESTQYFTFMDGEFYRYVQFEVIEKGTYKNVYDNVYILKSENIDDYIIYTNESFYFYDRKEDDIFKFFKMSDVPTFINVKVE
jgi:hypothetical protein